MAVFNGTKHADRINGTAGNDFISGDNGNDFLFGGGGNDAIEGGNGSDTLSGGAGDDVIDGGNGQDTAVYSGNRADYRLTQRSDGSIAVRDMRPGAPDGADRLVSIERIEFADGIFKIVDLIEAGDSAPIAGDDALVIAEDAGATVVTQLLLANDADADGDALKVTGVQAVSDKGASVAVAADGTVTYDPGAVFAALLEGEIATDSFTYTITDASGLTATATATVTVTGVGRAADPEPEPEPDAYFFVQEDGTTFDMLGAIIESFSIDVVGYETDGLLGTLNFDEIGGMLTFTADHDSSDALNVDAQQWTYFTVIGSEGERKVIGLVIEGVNDDIVAVDDAVAVGEGASTANLWSALVANEIDPDGGPATRRIVAVDADGMQGSVAFDASARTLVYSAAGIDLAPGETLTETFTYTVTDGYGSFDTATVTVTVTGEAGYSAAMAEAGPAAFVSGGAGEAIADFGAFAMVQLDIIGAELIVA